MPSSTSALEQRIDELRQDVQHLLARATDWNGDEVRVALVHLLERLDGFVDDAGKTVRAIQREETQLEEVLDVLFALARLDFSRRAPVTGDRPLDALAQVANMLSEELEVAQAEMAQARTQAVSATVAKSRFLAHMSHEIRTPLTALIGFADLLCSPTLTESDRLNYAMIIRRNGQHLLAVINDVLDLSRVEAGELAVEAVECSLVSILADVVALMRVRARESGLLLSVELATPVPERIRTDPTRLRQIVLNIVGNAIKFTRVGGVHIRVDHAVDRGRIVIAVEDTGIGVPADQLATLFQPFHQADPSMSRRFGGSGLGLAISKALVEALGGTLEADSEVGKGSTFRIALPVGAVPGAAMVASLDELPSDTPIMAPPRFAGTVLVVEDGLDNQVLLGALLRSYGLSVAFAADGEAALRRVTEAWHKGKSYDVVLMDMQMPVLDGYRATETLRFDGYKGPILALTAHALEGERERCLGVGCDDYISKPIERRVLVAALSRFLSPGAHHDDSLVYSTYASDPEMVPIIAQFVAALPSRIATLRAEVRVAGSAALPRLVHQLKGAAGGYGFAPLTDAAAAIERVLHANGEHAEVIAALDHLAALCERVRAGLP